MTDDKYPPLRAADPLVGRLMRGGRYGNDRVTAEIDAERVRACVADAVDAGADPEAALDAVLATFDDDESA